MEALLLAGIAGVQLLVIGVVFRFIVSLFKKSKTMVNEKIDNDIKPFVNEKQKEFKENKILKLKQLLDNDIITKEEYEIRKEKLQEN